MGCSKDENRPKLQGTEAPIKAARAAWQVRNSVSKPMANISSVSSLPPGLWLSLDKPRHCQQALMSTGHLNPTAMNPFPSKLTVISLNDSGRVTTRGSCRMDELLFTLVHPRFLRPFLNSLQ